MCKILSETQANAVLAEQVMGWEGGRSQYKYPDDPYDLWITNPEEMDFTFAKDWNPATKPEHALQCLEAWRNSNNHMSYTILSPITGIDEFSVRLSSGQSSYDIDFCTAICNAILAAIGAGQIGGE